MISTKRIFLFILLLLPMALFLKVSHPDFALPHPFGEAEPRFYNELVPMMVAAGPALGWHFVPCVNAAWSPDLQQFHVLLVDLSETHVQTAAHVPPSRELCQQQFDLYASFHAFWWEHAALGKEIGTHLTHAAIDDAEVNAAKSIATLATTYKGDLTDEEFNLLRNAIRAWPQRRRTRVVNGIGITLVHRDPHPGNILYPRAPATHGIKLIDWQSWRVDPATDDLAYTIAFHWPADVRAAWEEPMLRRYHQQLIALGVTDYLWDDLVYDYCASIARFLMIMAGHWRHEFNRSRLKLGLQAYVDWHCAEILFRG